MSPLPPQGISRYVVFRHCSPFPSIVLWFKSHGYLLPWRTNGDANDGGEGLADRICLQDHTTYHTTYHTTCHFQDEQGCRAYSCGLEVSVYRSTCTQNSYSKYQIACSSYVCDFVGRLRQGYNWLQCTDLVLQDLGTLTCAIPILDYSQFRVIVILRWSANCN